MGFDSQRKYPNEPMLAFLAGQPKGRVLEIGCGSGANLWAIAKEGFQADGMDDSTEGLLLCRKMLDLYGVTANLTQGDFHSLPYDDQTFDIVVDIRSMQHTDRKQEVVDEVYRVLTPNGVFFSYHLAKDSTVFQDQFVTMLDEAEARKLLSKFDVTVEKYSREYGGQVANYLAIIATKNRMTRIMDKVAEQVGGAVKKLGEV